MGGLFSSHKPEEKSRVSAQDKAVLKLKTQRDKMIMYKKKLSGLLAKEKEAARDFVKKGQKQKALAILKKRKYQESLLASTEGQLDNLEAMISSIEFKQMEQQVVSGLEAGNVALKQLNEQISIEDVERLMEETEDAVAYADEIQELLAGKLTADEDAEAEAEFEAMMAGEEVAFPQVPSGNLETDAQEVAAESSSASNTPVAVPS